MCGIVAYVGRKQALPYIKKALTQLQYRGYDSWGWVLWDDNDITLRKGLGKLLPDNVAASGRVGIGHVRWSSFGSVCVQNAHPIEGGLPTDNNLPDTSCYVVHNGNIENYRELRESLERAGYRFYTETDTEVVAHLFDHLSRDRSKASTDVFYDILKRVSLQLKGQYAIAIMSRFFPAKVGLCCLGSPLVITDGGYAASDPHALSGYSRTYTRMRDGDIAILTKSGVFCWDSKKNFRLRESWKTPTNETDDLSNYPHYMLKEIHDQPIILRKPFELKPLSNTNKPDRMVLFGCGSSYYASLLGKAYFNEYGIAAEVEYAADLSYRQTFNYDKGTVFVALTQSGETKDTLQALDRIQMMRKGPLFIVTNVPGSSATEFGQSLLLNAGHERGVAATKTFTLQSCLLLEVAATLSEFTGIAKDIHDVIHSRVPSVLSKLLADESKQLIQQLARVIIQYRHVLFLARGLNYPIALEAALKLKEVAYIHAEAIHASEMKHGPIALIDESTLSVFIVSGEEDLDKILINMAEIKARGGTILCLCDTASQDKVLRLVDSNSTFVVPSVHKLAQPIVMNVPLQLLAYESAVLKGNDVDCPRSLSKCVTVE